MRKFYLILAAMMLLCLAPMPYGYFQLVRFLTTLAFGVMAYRYYKERKEWFAYTFGILALLFQPFFKIALGRAVWNIVDVIVAIGLIILFFYEWKKGGAKSQIKDVNPPINIIGGAVDDNKFEFTLQGKLGPKELIYVASEKDKDKDGSVRRLGADDGNAYHLSAVTDEETTGEACTAISRALSEQCGSKECHCWQ